MWWIHNILKVSRLVFIPFRAKRGLMRSLQKEWERKRKEERDQNANILRTCVCFQGARRPGRRASGAAFAPFDWMGSPWTWRRGPRSPPGSGRGVRATAAATAPSARTGAAAWRDPAAFPATAARPPTPGPSATEVRRLPQCRLSYTQIMEDLVNLKNVLLFCQISNIVLKCSWSHAIASVKCIHTVFLFVFVLFVLFFIAPQMPKILTVCNSRQLNC